MTKGGYARLSVEMAAVLAVAGAYLYYRPKLGPRQAEASPVGPAVIEAGPPINMVIEVLDVPFVGETDEALAAVIGHGEEGQARVVNAADMAALRNAIRDLTEGGQMAARPGVKASLKPGQPASVKVSGRTVRAPLSAPARDELSLGVVATWVQSGAVQLDAWFRRDRIDGFLTTQSPDHKTSGGRSRVLPGEALVVSQVMEGARYIVVLRLEKPLGGG